MHTLFFIIFISDIFIIISIIIKIINQFVLILECILKPVII